MLVVCVSDLHENLPEIPACDLLLIAGDITFGFKGDLVSQQSWIINDFKRWCASVPADEVVVVAGNHDQSIAQWGWVPGYMPCVYLEDEQTEFAGLKIWGTPWQPWFHDWAFNAPSRNGEEFLAEKFAAIPDDTDIIVCHGPPLGYGDQVGSSHAEDRSGQPHAGSQALLDAIDRVRPRLVVCGHIHSGYGIYQRGDTAIINAALVNNTYKPVNAPIICKL